MIAGTTLDRQIAGQAARQPEAAAVVGLDEAVSYRRLEAQARAIAQGIGEFLLGSLGRESGRQPIFALLADRSWTWVSAVLGSWKAGVAYLPLDPEWPLQRSQQILDDARVTVVLADPACRRLAESLNVPHVLGLEKLARSRPAPSGESSARPDDLAYVIYTSGSTGVPKGVCIEHRNLSSYVRGFSEQVDLSEVTSWAAVSSLAADLSYTAVYPALAHGGTIHLVPKSLALDGPALAAYLRRWQVAGLKITPSHMAALLDGSRAPLPSKCLVFGGEVLHPALIERVRAIAPHCAVFNHYGPAEAAVGASMYSCPPATALTASVPIGKPLSGTRLHVRDETGRPVRNESMGELYIEGPGVGRGYLGRADLTAERFSRSADRGSTHRVFRTGDLGVRLPDGNIRFLGRRDNQVKIRGNRVELEEVESTLRCHPLVSQCAVVAESRDDRGPILIAYVASDSPDPGLIEALRAFTRARLPAFMVPTEFRRVDSLPLLPNGKVDRQVLTADSASSSPSSIPRRRDHPQAYVAEVVVSIWREVLHTPSFGVGDDFFSFGGDSLMAVQVVKRLNEALQTEVSIADLFIYSTSQTLAERLVEIAG
jgi:amino acid adenylation domain-containing protein